MLVNECTGEGVQDLNESVYYDLVTQPMTDEISNSIRVVASPLLLSDDLETIFDSDDTYIVSSLETITVVIDWNDKPVEIENVVISLITLIGSPSIVSSDIFAWGASITVQGSENDKFSLSAVGKKYNTLSSTIAVSEDDDSIKEYGRIVFELDENHLIQNDALAQKIADNLLINYKGVQNNAEITYPGNLVVGLADSILLTEYKDDLIDTRNFFYIIRQQIEYKGSLDIKASLRRIT